MACCESASCITSRSSGTRGATVLTRTHYWFQHEPCWYVRKKNAPWYGKAGENSTIWDSPSPKFIMGGSDEEKFDHPTQKPVELMRRPILNHTKPGELVYEPFLGSGTTLAAAELTERVCYGLELDPKYVDVVVERWQALSGKKATLEGDGRTFDVIHKGSREVGGMSKKAPARGDWQSTGHGSKFGRKKEEAIAALLTQRNVEEAARAAGIGTRTLIPVAEDTGIRRRLSGSATSSRFAIQRPSAARVERRRLDAAEDHGRRECAGIGPGACCRSRPGARQAGNRNDDFQFRLTALEQASEASKPGRL